MKKLIILVGPPGAGKSTFAKKYKAEGYTYINQDSQGKGHLQLFDTAILLGENVIVDRMGFNKQQRAKYLDVANDHGYETEIVVLHQPYHVCFVRCMARKDHETIKDETNARAALNLFFTKYERPTDDEADLVTRVWPEGDKPKAIICDLDGTLCDVDHRLHTVRPPKEWEEEIALAKKDKRKNIYGWKADWVSFFDNISGDSVNRWCADILKSLHKEYTVVFCSGRPDNYRKPTYDWLDKHGFTNFHHDVYLYMRPRADSRQDNIIKEIILDFEILTRFEPSFMIDDRKQVVDMWRSRGYVVLHCAEGDF